MMYLCHDSRCVVFILLMGLVAMPQFGCPEKVKLNPKKSEQSSTYSRNDTSFPASLAVDGDANSDLSKEHCSHTAEEEKAWWRVELDAPYDITDVKIYNRRSYAYARLSRLNITVGDSPDLSKNALCRYYDATVPKSGSAFITCKEHLRGMYVGIQKTSSSAVEDGMVVKNQGFLTLCEVEVFGNKVKLEKINLDPSNAAQSSTLGDKNMTAASKALDRDTNPDASKGHCSHTNTEAKAWSRVKLDKANDINGIKVYNRLSWALRRLKKLNIKVGNSTDMSRNALCSFYNATVPQRGSAYIRCARTLRGIYIYIEKTTHTDINHFGKMSTNEGFLTLCEVEAFKEVRKGSGTPNGNRDASGFGIQSAGGVSSLLIVIAAVIASVGIL